ncbi:MAG: HEAT repeat domain-containing protein [Anaerolineae bacterium]|nr:HEAT repeat domain-containing protein [Anaerolineae bacterium]
MSNVTHEVKQVMAELRDVNKERRRTAIMKLGMIGGEDALRMLIFVVSNKHEDLIVRGRAAMMLGNLGDVRAVEPLIEALRAPGYQTPLFAAEALGKIGDPRAIPALQPLLQSDHERYREVAGKALVRLQSRDKKDEIAREPEPSA